MIGIASFDAMEGRIPMHHKAVIFDLDGTLLNTLDDLADSTNYALARHGFPARTREEVRQFVGNGVAMLLHRAVPAGTGPEEEVACLDTFRRYYLTHMRCKTAPYPGIPELLERLNRAGCAVAVVSNKFDAAVKALCADYFGARVPVAIGESEGVRKKPAPDTVYRALEELGIPAARAVYVGDSEVDLETARNAGMDCISVSWGFRETAFLLACGARTVAANPEALERLLGGTARP